MYFHSSLVYASRRVASTARAEWNYHGRYRPLSGTPQCHHRSVLNMAFVSPLDIKLTAKLFRRFIAYFTFPWHSETGKRKIALKCNIVHRWRAFFVALIAKLHQEYDFFERVLAVFTSIKPARRNHTHVQAQLNRSKVVFALVWYNSLTNSKFQNTFQFSDYYLTLRRL